MDAAPGRGGRAVGRLRHGGCGDRRFADADSDYVFRGFTQTGEKPAIQGGIEFEAGNGFYAGTWGSSISWLSDSDPAVSSQVELDGYFGYRGALSDAVGFDVGAIHYRYPGSYPAGFDRADTWEAYAGIEAAGFGLRYAYALTDLFGIPGSDGSGYLEASYGLDFAGRWTLGLHVGRQYVSGPTGQDYTDRRVSLGLALPQAFALELAWTDVNLHEADSRAFVSLTKSF
ncbi:TorF family putative porin [Coralloluteibacterium thermophilus]|uniref:TorF family putative porin n=1 Tax=Coralloluteibacterium thermophilum TaxID=2707049 RepID=A0ABV9NJQ5_9GAMM